MRRFAVVGVVGILAVAVGAGQPPAAPPPEWRQVFRERLPLLGGGNWVLVAPADYPLRSRSGLEYVFARAEHLDVVRAALDEIAAAKHVRPVVSVREELPFVAERDTPGIGLYRDGLKRLFADRRLEPVPDADARRRFEEAVAATPNPHVIVLKTNGMIPYGTVLIELRSGLLSDDAEERLRERMRDGR